MEARFLIGADKVRQLAATRQGRVSLGGFAYQVGYAVARLASLYCRRPLLELEGHPLLLRFDWADDLEEVEGGRTVFTQCKRMATAGQTSRLAAALWGFAPKWLWTPDNSKVRLRFRLVCTDPRFSRRGALPLSSLPSGIGQPDLGEVLSAALSALSTPPGPGTDRAIWQAEAETYGLRALFTAIWENTEILYLPADTLADDPAVPLFPAERDALALLTRLQHIHPGRQQSALSALRTLLHANVIEFDPHGSRLAPELNLAPRIIGYDDVHYSLLEFQLEPREALPFQIVTRTFLEMTASEPKQPFIARRPRWRDVVHGQDSDIKFLERESTEALLTRVRRELLAQLGASEPLPIIFVLGAPGAGKTTLVLRVAARAIQEGLAVVAAPKLNLQEINDDEYSPFIQALERLEEGPLPVLLVLDDPFFANSGWADLLCRMAKRSRRIAVLGASPDYLFSEFAYKAVKSGQIRCDTFHLTRPSIAERRSLAALYGRQPGIFDAFEDDFLVLAMEASAGLAFDVIIDRIWTTLNDGQPFPPRQHPRYFPWPVRAYLLVCLFHRFYMRCPELLMRAALSLFGDGQPAADLAHQLQRLLDSQGWAIFSLEESKRGGPFLGTMIGAAHPRIAAAAWRQRPAPVFDVVEWVLEASLSSPEAALHVGSLAGHLDREKKDGQTVSRLAALWQDALMLKKVEARSFCLLHEAFCASGGSTAALRGMRTGLEASIRRTDEQSWLAVLGLAEERPFTRRRQLDTIVAETTLVELTHCADFLSAPIRASRFLRLLQPTSAAFDALASRVREKASDPQAYRLLLALARARPQNVPVRESILAWLVKRPISSGTL